MHVEKLFLREKVSLVFLTQGFPIEGRGPLHCGGILDKDIFLEG